jgi:hypothetical protein
MTDAKQAALVFLSMAADQVVNGRSELELRCPGCSTSGMLYFFVSDDGAIGCGACMAVAYRDRARMCDFNLDTWLRRRHP